MIAKARGASFNNNDAVDLLLGNRNNQHPDNDDNDNIGSRWFAAAQHSQDEGNLMSEFRPLPGRKSTLGESRSITLVIPLSGKSKENAVDR